MKKIIIKRPIEKVNKYCAYDIFLGNSKTTELKNGEETILEIPEDKERLSLKAKIMWCGSKSLRLNNLKDQEIVQISGNELLNRKLPLMGAIFPMIGLLVFNGESILTKTLGTILIFSFMLIIIAALTFWKDHWLLLKKPNYQG